MDTGMLQLFVFPEIDGDKQKEKEEGNVLFQKTLPTSYQ
jgi:hypothetical protein